MSTSIASAASRRTRPRRKPGAKSVGACPDEQLACAPPAELVGKGDMPDKPEGISVYCPEPGPEDSAAVFERAMRPQQLADYEGQAQLRAQLQVYLGAAIARGQALDHVLLSGPAGMGKTTLAQIIAAELGVGLRITSGPVLERAGDVAGLLVALSARDVLFIDEIHRLPAQVEEVLYPAMEDGRIDVLIGQGSEARAVTVPLEPFTLIGATTRLGDLSAPLRDRFGIVGRMQPYTLLEIERILMGNSRRLGLALDPKAGRTLARCARGTPRIANRLLRRLRDVVQSEGGLTANKAGPRHVKALLSLLDIEPGGLDALDRQYLKALYEHWAGGPVGVQTLAQALGEASATLEDSVEPFLVQSGLLVRTSRGRMLTERAKERFKPNA